MTITLNSADFKIVSKRLACDTLLRALKDYAGIPIDSNDRGEMGKYKNEVMDWIDEKSQVVFGFRWVEEQSGVNPNAIMIVIDKIDNGLDLRKSKNRHSGSK